MAHRSTALIVILVFGVLFTMLYVSQIYATTSIPTKPILTDDEVIQITKADLEKAVAPNHLDKYVYFSKYYGYPFSLVYIHTNGTQYYINTTNGFTVDHTCVGCNFRDLNMQDISGPLRGHLFYIADGSWQDSSVGNCSYFIYAVDAKSGEILWSVAGDVDYACSLKPPDW